MSKSLRSAAAATAFAIVAIVLAACSSGSGGYGSPAASTPPSAASSAPAPAGGAAVLTISGFAFSPLTVKAGQTVTVKNNDTAAHTVASSAGGFDVNVPGSGQATFTAPSQPGSYPLTCDFHANMHGEMIVT